jgi:exodeoxyribonuclease-1
MTRALRPEGIEWPVDAEGKATNRLELLTKANSIDHFAAHDALSDVEALIAVTKLIKTKQPQLYDYLLKLRDKKEVQKAVKEILHLDEIIKSDDANDAVAMVLCHLKKGVIPDFSI